MTQPERRRAPRVAQSFPLSIVNPREIIHAETRNLSASGVYCTLSRYMEPMSKLQLNFTLPKTSAPIRCTGVVVRVEPAKPEPGTKQYQVAIFFTEISDPDRAALTSFIEQQIGAQNPRGGAKSVA